MPDNKKGSLGTSIFLLFIALVLIGYTTVKQLNSDKEKNKLVEDISNKVSQDVKETLSKSINSPQTSVNTDYQSLAGMKTLTIIRDFESWTPNSTIPDEKVNEQIILRKGQLSKGYILIKASIDGKPLSQWESLYVKINNLGGHIYRKDSLPVPTSDDTQLLYTLNNVPFLNGLPYREDIEPNRANWFTILNNNRRANFLSFISSLKPARINEITIYYACIENDSCELTTSK